MSCECLPVSVSALTFPLPTFSIHSFSPPKQRFNPPLCVLMTVYFLLPLLLIFFYRKIYTHPCSTTDFIGLFCKYERTVQRNLFAAGRNSWLTHHSVCLQPVLHTEIGTHMKPFYKCKAISYGFVSKGQKNWAI